MIQHGHELGESGPQGGHDRIDGVVLRAGDYGNALDKMMMSQVFTGQELDNNLTPAMKAAQEVANSAPSAIGDLEQAITAAGDEALTASERFDAFKEAVDLAIGFARDPAAAQRVKARREPVLTISRAS